MRFRKEAGIDMRMKTNDRAIILSNLPWEGDVSITGTNHPPEHTDHHHHTDSV